MYVIQLCKVLIISFFETIESSCEQSVLLHEKTFNLLTNTSKWYYRVVKYKYNYIDIITGMKESSRLSSYFVMNESGTTAKPRWFTKPNQSGDGYLLQVQRLKTN